MKKQSGFTAVELISTMLILAVSIIGIWGWVWNIVKIAGSGFDPLTGMVVLRCIGVFVAPLGVVLGFL